MSGIDDRKMIELYRDMLRIRMIEESVAELYPQQQMRCPVHLCTGQEAVAVGVCAALEDKDYVVGNHRSHGHYLAKGGDLKAMMAEMYGKAAGCSKGKGGSMHLVDLSANVLGTTPIVGGSIPVGVGIAFGTLMQGGDAVVAIFFGDAATEEGVFCESLNFASLKKLPVVFVCENNHFSVYSPLSVRQPEERDNLAIAKAYGIDGSRGDGNDVLGIYALAQEAVSRAREGRGPYFLELETYRWREHCGPYFDNHLGYRAECDLNSWVERCPVRNLERKLLAEGLIDEKTTGEFRETIASEIKEAVDFAKQSPFPEAAELYTDVYADKEDAGDSL